MTSSSDDNTPYSFSAELDAALKRLKTTQLRYMNGFIKTVFNLTLINAILSGYLSLKKKFNLERFLWKIC